MDNQTFSQYALCAMMRYVYIQRGVYPTTLGFARYYNNDDLSISIYLWDDPSPQPSISTLQAYTLAEVQDALLGYQVQNHIIAVFGQVYNPYQTTITTQTPQTLSIINNYAYCFNQSVFGIQSKAFMDSSDNGGMTVALIDTTSNILIASDYITSTKPTWKSMQMLSPSSVFSTNNIEFQAYCSSSTGIGYVNGFSINIYEPI